jgi:hypothetical protein
MEQEWIADLATALDRRLVPSITVWNRIEGQPRSVSFDRALKAEVRDALWMLSRQWQMGEFQGEDAGSPCSARLRVDAAKLSRYRAGGAASASVAFDESMPLDTQVERLPVALTRLDRPQGLDLRLAIGRYWLKLIEVIGDYAGAYRTKYGVAAPDPANAAHAELLAHPEVWQAFAAAAAGRLVDGGALYAHLTGAPPGAASDGIALADAADGAKLDAAGLRFVRWYRRLIAQPAVGDAGPESAWIPDRLEYQFGCSAPGIGGGERDYVAEEYYQGRLDWYNLDLVPAAEPAPPPAPAVLTPARDRAAAPAMKGETQALVPVPIEYEGMPSTRWWEFEDRRTNFGAIDATTSDLAKLLFLEFSLVYANDWFVIPCSLETGSIATVRGLVVNNVFGERFWIEAAGRGPDDGWQLWRMFGTTTVGRRGEPADTSLMLLPSVPKIQESDPTEEVLLLRDEVANMVWGVEELVPVASGASKRGSEAAAELRGFFERRLASQLALGPAPDRDFAAPVYYKAMTNVPEQWIPFIPVHVPGSNRRIQLQRAALPRVLERDPNDPVKVEPRTTLLRHGLDQQNPDLYFLHNEEVPRSGVRVRLAFKRTRWRDGRVVLWLAARKNAGRGEGSSGLAFDQLVPSPVDRVRK